MVYLPTLLFSLGEGAVMPLIPVMAMGMGADVAGAALISSALVVGQLCGNIPGGWAVARIGERYTMTAASVIALVAAAGLIFAPGLPVFTAAVFLLGFCAAVFGLARHAFMTTRVPLDFRARALSLLGGSFRLGIFVGPIVAAGLLGLFGTEVAAVVFLAACLVVLGLLVLFGPDPEKLTAPVNGRSHLLAEDSGEAVTGSIPTQQRAGVMRAFWENRGVLARLGASAAMLSASRSARQIALPLWGLALGLDAQTIALVIGVVGSIDFALFYASGQVMDRFGRLWAAMPAMLMFAAGFLGLALVAPSDTAILWFGLFAAVMSVGNGMSSGILLTLGADVAPPDDPAPFLGSWRTLTDAGGAVAPLLLSGLVAVFSLPVATAAMGVLSLLGAGGFLRYVPRYVPRNREH